MKKMFRDFFCDDQRVVRHQYSIPYVGDVYEKKKCCICIMTPTL